MDFTASGTLKPSASIFSTDTFTVTFNRPPAVNALSISDNDTLWVGEHFNDTIPLYCSVSDADNDPFNASIAWGADTFSCGDTTLLPADSMGTYQWTFTVTDAFGQRVEQSGSTVIGFEHTVCFAGHSIVVGYGGDGSSGGFRAIRSCFTSINR